MARSAPPPSWVWSDGAFNNAVPSAENCMFGSDGSVYRAYSRSIYRGTKLLYTWPTPPGSVHGDTTTLHFRVRGYNDWFYFADSGYTPKVFFGADGTIYMRMYAYNPVSGTAVTVAAYTSARLEVYISPNMTLHSAFDCGLDPISGLGLIAHATWLNGGNNNYSQLNVMRMTLGTPTSSPSYTAYITSSGDDSETYFIPYPVSACAYNNVGLVYYHKNDGTKLVKRVTSLAASSWTSLRSGYDLAAYMDGPNLFVDDGDYSLIRDSEGNTWDISGGTGAYVSVGFLGADENYWYVCYYNHNGSSPLVRRVVALLKTGTTVVTLADPTPFYYVTAYPASSYDTYLESGDIQYEKFFRIPKQQVPRAPSLYKSQMLEVS